jgi:hypothetical protein
MLHIILCMMWNDQENITDSFIYEPIFETHVVSQKPNYLWTHVFPFISYITWNKRLMILFKSFSLKLHGFMNILV